ncbi:MAG: hypothetical protein J5486_09915 [Bacteroidaceae bacterium]|nr:hypothetical protein [Bacteroidaceae bacterium]
MRNKAQVRAVVKALLFIVAVMACFRAVEFSSQDAILFDSGIDIGESWLVPYSLRIWLAGRLTLAGGVVLLTLLFALIIFMQCFVKWIRTAHYSESSAQNVKLLGSIMFLLWTIGWGLFLQAFLYYPEEYQFVNSELLMRSATSSLDCFMLDIDSDIVDQLEHHPHLKGAISFVSLLAFSCTVILLVSLVYARLNSYIQFRFWTRIDKRHPRLYLLFGMNEASTELVRSIRANDPLGVCVFVEQAHTDDDDDEGWSHIIGMMTHRTDTFQTVRELKARLEIINTPLHQLDIQHDDVLGEANLENIKRKLRRLRHLCDDGECVPELHMFFLSEQSEDNIRDVEMLCGDRLVKELVARSSQGGGHKRMKVVFYAHGRLDSVNSVAEDMAMSRGVDLRVIDSAHLSIELLKTKAMQHVQPYNFVTVESDATVSSPFNSLVIGFNPVGQDALRFLYEYSAFVATDRSAGVRRSPFCCHVVDADMATLAPSYLSSHLRGSACDNPDYQLANFDDDDKDVTSLVHFHNFGYGDSRFFALLDQIMPSLNYVVVAVGDDVQGATLAVKILRLALREDIDLSRFKILLRSYSSDNLSRMNRIVEFYNRCASSVCPSATEVITVFGSPEQVFSYETVVADRIQSEAVLYYNCYERGEQALSEPFDDSQWLQRRHDAFSCDDSNSPLYARIMALRRKEIQDFENAFHRHVKTGMALLASKSDHLPGNIKATPIYTTLSQMEHLRWNASLQMLGYVYGPQRRDDLLQHPCLVSCDKLSEDDKAYDDKVVDVSFYLNHSSGTR